MRYKCKNCGAPLEIEPETSVVACRYCHTTTHREPGTSDRGRPATHARRWAIGAAALSVVTLSIVLLSGTWRDEPAPTPPPPVAAAPVERPPPAPAPAPVRPAPAPKPVAPPAPTPAPARAAGTVDPAEVLGKNQAKKVLEPALLACMHEAGVHYLVTRLGQGYDAKTTGPLPPLRFVDTSWVDYHEFDDLTDTDLGQCILRASAQVNTRAFKGNYIYFGLRDERVADPLAGASERLDHPATTAALTAFDGEARECMRQFSDTAPVGESISLDMEFRGVDGVPTRIRIFYQDPGSPYSQCVIEAYSQARSPQFRSLTGKTTHNLSP